jgi:ankyrin repeat protein
MSQFQVYLKSHRSKKIKCPSSAQHSIVMKLNEILLAYLRGEINLNENDYSPSQAEYFMDKVGAALFDLLISDPLQPNHHQLIDSLLDTELISANQVKNFLDQTLLHFAADSNNLKLCSLLVTKYGADCLLEDTYRQTPFLVAVKKNHAEVFKLFVTSLSNSNYNRESLRRHVIHAAYISSCMGNLTLLEYLFAEFDLDTDQLVNEISFLKNYDSNPIHVACFKGHFQVVQFLVKNLSTKTKELFINSSLNEFRKCTPLEEAFKGFLMIDLKNELELVPFTNSKLGELIRSRYETKASFVKIINFLVENGARFSTNFLVQNGLVNLVGQVFTGANRDADFVQFLYCITYLFKFNVNELFSDNDFVNDVNFDSTIMSDHEAFKLNNDKSAEANGGKVDFSLDANFFLERFLQKVYSTCLKVLKDYKFVCLNYFFNIVINLYLSGQFRVEPGCIQNKFAYIKERNADLFADLVEFLQQNNTNKMFTLQTLCCIKIKQSVPNFSIKKLDSLRLPSFLKNDIFLNNCLSLNHNLYLNKQSEFLKYLAN